MLKIKASYEQFHGHGIWPKQIPEIFSAIQRETDRQHSQNRTDRERKIFTSEAVLEATGSIFTNKYAEGYPGKRYYGGCEFADQVETLARDRAKQLFGAEHVNVQPHSGSQANQAAFAAVLNPGDTILGLSLAHGGHLTHGFKLNFSGKTYNAIHYGVRKDDELIDFDEVERLAAETQTAHDHHRWAAAYSRIWNFSRASARLADRHNALLLCDMAHFSGLVAAGPPSEPSRMVRYRHLDYPQDAARPPVRHHPCEGEVRCRY